MLRNWCCIIFLGWLGGILQAQNPTTCFEIESILVDACGAPEGENEMVRFHVGPAALNTASLTVNWPNNSWLGVCQNATTATNVAQLNSTITSCGFLLEPVAGILPAGATVILVSSTNFSTAANSFATLTDTLYIIFQCQGNTTGHFANATGSGTRTLSMSFGGSCNDAVTYDCQQLVDINGNTGLGGTTTDRDGSTTNFAWDNTASYVNYGCTAPYNPEVVNAGPDLSGCQGDTISLNGFVSNSLNSILWSGGSGVWINPNQANAQYVIGMSDMGTINLQLSANNCNGPINDVAQVLVDNLPVINLNPSGTISICAGDMVTLDAGPGGPYIWSTGDTTNTIDVFASGIYTVSTNSSCGSLIDSAVVNVDPVPFISLPPNFIFCENSSVLVNPTFAGNIVWYDGSNVVSKMINVAGNYFVAAFNSCGADTAFFSVNSSFVDAGFSADSIEGVAPLEVNFTNTSFNGSNYLWDFGNGGSSTEFEPLYTFDHPGHFLVVLTTTNIDGCEDTASLMMNVLVCDNKVFIPNTFTPNMDEVNPEWKVISNCAYEATVAIFNRWGQEIFSTTDLSAGWNGNTQSGNPLPVGVYVYRFEFTDVNGIPHTYQGMVNLIR